MGNSNEKMSSIISLGLQKAIGTSKAIVDLNNNKIIKLDNDIDIDRLASIAIQHKNETAGSIEGDEFQEDYLMLMKEEREKKEKELLELCDEYGYVSVANSKDVLFFLCDEEIKEIYSTDTNRQRLELAQLIKLLHSCCESIEIRGTITRPRKHEVKNTITSSSINTSYTLSYLYSCLCKKLHYLDDNCYIYEAHPELVWEDIEDDEKSSNETREPFSFPYTIDEIEWIIEYESKQIEQYSKSKNIMLGSRAYFLYEKLLDKEIFEKVSSDNRHPKGDTKTKQYSFIYDIFVINKNCKLIGKLGESNHEKYEYVKNWLTAFRKYKESQQKQS